MYSSLEAFVLTIHQGSQRLANTHLIRQDSTFQEAIAQIVKSTRANKLVRHWVSSQVVRPETRQALVVMQVILGTISCVMSCRRWI